MKTPEEISGKFRDDEIQLLRLIQYVGPREKVESEVARSIHGTRIVAGVKITVITLNEFPLVLPFKEQNDGGN